MNAIGTVERPTTARAPTPGPGGMYMRESGSPGAPAIVFIHGAGQSGREWCEHMTRLAGFHCLAPDLPGFGRSNRLAPASREHIADLIAELIETRVPAKRASVVGISSAGTVIHALLDRHPDRVERAIIDGSPPYDAPWAGRALSQSLASATGRMDKAVSAASKRAGRGWSLTRRPTRCLPRRAQRPDPTR